MSDRVSLPTSDGQRPTAHSSHLTLKQLDLLQYELFAGLLQVLKPELPAGTKVVVVAETPPESPRSHRSSSSSDGNGSSDDVMSILP